ncbi:S8 family peptidase [Cupriavidus consociatus]|uniref:S8 family peptidase n=1 Tax=Cupriavidus consociatus TaxID=2821357 RepID=UPI001AE1C169|nr:MULTISPECIES: S8 family serine peptidase [unclassified Cupriavidus]MBP0622934.1 S8 family serine peptidase [Cupriavidus sp. LEh25]MDK2659622.1 S8 family serine peptidase [Cupriavidus sp. LEh21]
MKRYIILRRDATQQTGLRNFGPALEAQDRALPNLSTERIPDHAIAELAGDPLVEMITPAMPTRLITPLTSDASASEMSEPNWGIEAIGASQSPCTGAGVTMAVLDTGIHRTHPAFDGITLIEKDFSGCGDGDSNGHGTHCAGTIFGRDVGKRIGVARGVNRAVIGKVLRDDGTGQSDMVFNALIWAMQERADIISMSLGFDFPGMVTRLTQDGWPVDLATSNALEAYRGNLRMFDAIMSVLKAQTAFGVAPLVIAAAGNESRRAVNPEYRIAAALPAAAADVVSVAAVGRAGTKYAVANFSNSLALIAGPGVDITSAWPDGGLHTISGTSMACPHVAGIAALWWDSVRRSGVRPTAKNVMARLLAHARKDEFVANTDEADIGQGLVMAPQG